MPAVERPGSPFVGRDAGELAGLGPIGIAITDKPLEAFVEAEGVLDFTSPAGTVEFAGLAAQARIVHVIGTTGCGADDDAKIRAAARHARIVKSGNMSLGVNLLGVLTEKAARALGPAAWDIEILEMHHKHKVDAPSGTALLLGEAAARGRSIALSEHSVRVRDGHTGARPQGTIGFATLRGGSVDRRTLGHSRRRRRTGDAVPQRHRPFHLRAGRHYRSTLGTRPETRLLLHARCSRAQLTPSLSSQGEII